MATPDAAPDDPWWGRYDFDGDGRNDRVEVDFTGGAHCWYRLGIVSSATGRTFPIPFQLDGGYTRGLSLERPGNFTIERGGDPARVGPAFAIEGGLRGLGRHPRALVAERGAALDDDPEEYPMVRPIAQQCFRVRS